MSRYLALLLIIALPFSSCDKAKLKKRRKKEIERVAGTWHWNGFYRWSLPYAGQSRYVEFKDSVITVEKVGKTSVKILGYTYRASNEDVYEFDPLVFVCVDCTGDFGFRMGALRYYGQEDSIYLFNAKSRSSSSETLELTANH